MQLVLEHTLCKREQDVVGSVVDNNLYCVIIIGLLPASSSSRLNYCEARWLLYIQDKGTQTKNLVAGIQTEQRHTTKDPVAENFNNNYNTDAHSY